jgi:hypothetical protein
MNTVTHENHEADHAFIGTWHIYEMEAICLHLGGRG